MSSEELIDLLSALAATPVKIQSLLNEIPESQHRRRSAEGEFSCVETVCHLSDIEAEGYSTRINRILNEDKPYLADIDGLRLSVEREYNNQDVNEALRAFARARTKSTTVISELRSEELGREGTLEGVGVLTLAKLLVMMRDHDASHLKEIEEMRQRLRS